MRKGEFARKIGISRQSLRNYMEGITEPSFADAERMITATGTKGLAVYEKFTDEEE